MLFNTTDSVQQVHYYTLEQFNRTLAFESAQSGNLVRLFRDILPSANKIMSEGSVKLKSLTQYIGGKVGESHLFSSRGDELNKIADKISKNLLLKTNYVNFSDVPVNVPEGFSGSLYNFSDFCVELNRSIDRTISDFITEYRFMLSGYLNNSEKTIVNSNDFYDRLINFNDNFIENLSQFYIIDGEYRTRTITKLGEVLPRLSEIKPLIHNVVILNRTLNTSALNIIGGEIKLTTETIDMVINKSKDVTYISKKEMEMIGSSVYALGILVDNYVMFKTICMSLVGGTKVVLEKVATLGKVK